MGFKTARRIYKKLYDQYKKNYIANLPIIADWNIVVEIDKSKFGLRKFERCNFMEGIWVLSGVGRTVERILVLIPVVGYKCAFFLIN